MAVLGCQDREGCEVWAKTYTEHMANQLPRAQRLHEQFLERLPRGTSAWSIGIHATERQSLRAIGDAELQAVIECGEPCEVYFEQWGGRMLISGETDQGRPLHIILEFEWPPSANQRWEWEVVTSYDPRTEPWRWSKDFKQRLCRCPGHVDYEQLKGGSAMRDAVDLLGGAPRQGCRQAGLACAEELVAGGTTTTIVVRAGPNQPRLLILVHHFPTYRCQRCGKLSYHGEDRVRLAQDLEARIQRGEQLPAEMEFHPPVAA